MDRERPHAPRFSYRRTHGSLKYPWLSGTPWLSVPGDNGAADAGFFTSLVLVAPGRPRISHLDEMDGHLRYAWLEGRDRTWLTLVVRGAR